MLVLSKLLPLHPIQNNHPFALNFYTNSCPYHTICHLISCCHLLFAIVSMADLSLQWMTGFHRVLFFQKNWRTLQAIWVCPRPICLFICCLYMEELIFKWILYRAQGIVIYKPLPWGDRVSSFGWGNPTRKATDCRKGRDSFSCSKTKEASLWKNANTLHSWSCIPLKFPYAGIPFSISF